MASRAIDNRLHFDLDLSPAANSVINRVAIQRRLDPGQVLARAIALLDLEDKARTTGGSLAVVDSESNIVSEIS